MDREDGEGKVVLTDHFRRVADDEVVADREFHSPEEVREARVASNQLDKTAAITDALGKLDPEDNQDWTSRGFPSVTRLHVMTGMEISRGDIQDAYPGFDREMARAHQVS